MINDDSTKKWFRAAIVGLGVSLLWVALLWRCLPLLHWNRPVLLLFLPPIWIFLLVGLRSIGRVIALVALPVGAFMFVGPHLNPIPIAPSESAVVHALVAKRSKLASMGEGARASEVGKPAQGYPVERFYTFYYLAPGAESGKREGFSIAATLLPNARSCGCMRNFTIYEDGDVHYTTDWRAATRTDPSVEVPLGY